MRSHPKVYYLDQCRLATNTNNSNNSNDNRFFFQPLSTSCFFHSDFFAGSSLFGAKISVFINLMNSNKQDSSNIGCLIFNERRNEDTVCLFGVFRNKSIEVVTSPPLYRKVGCSRPTMIRARCLRVKQPYPAQKNNQKNCM